MHSMPVCWVKDPETAAISLAWHLLLLLLLGSSSLFLATDMILFGRASR